MFEEEYFNDHGSVIEKRTIKTKAEEANVSVLWSVKCWNRVSNTEKDFLAYC
jgi:hypothetical protein